MKRAVMVMCVAVMAAGALGGVMLAEDVVRGGSQLDENDDDQGGGRRLSATLRGIEEPPAVSSTGRGSFSATILSDGAEVAYELSYSMLEGDVLQSHIHLGQKGVNGGIVVFLCTNLGNGPAGTPACPGPREGTVTGTFTAASVGGGANAQGIAPGELGELLRAIDRDVTYVNVHTVKHPGGELRGQIDPD